MLRWNAGLAVLLIVLRLVYGSEWAADGMFTIFALVFWFLGVQLIGMGLLGEYIGRISRDVQGRPRFIVHKVVGACLEPVPDDYGERRMEVPAAKLAGGTGAAR
jgi:hypothetical protein